MSIDKLAPQAVEAEQSVLGSILIDPEAILKVADFLHPPDFYRQQHSDIYEAMLGLHGQREPIDLVTLGDELARRDRLEPIGGAAYLASLMNMVPTAVHVEHYGRIVERKAVLRNLIGAAGKIAAVGYEEANDAEVEFGSLEERQSHPGGGVHLGEVHFAADHRHDVADHDADQEGDRQEDVEAVGRDERNGDGAQCARHAGVPRAHTERE